ncbi:uncharacterized protein LOC119069981 [Bradysia coprophila]|uniref:uncharacterized protein LOC119069981 n=1 Tax=Bradysia coprophila TaxID=38358 RepID=UPI00187DA631|nr:uncharacterized protein LOC119069981 [Bradysia coprophila]
MNSKVFVFLILSTTSYRISLAQSYNVTDNESTQLPSSNTETPRTTSQSEDYPKWVSSSRGGKIPLGAIQGGIDSDGAILYVARAFHETEIIPGKLNSLSKLTYMGNNGIEYAKTSYEVLVGCKAHWEIPRENNIPPNAIIAGVAYDGAYYVCRVRLLGNLTNGKMHNRHSRCYIPYGGIEHTYNEYEILCCGR